MMRELAGGIGDPQVRNWGTIGGSVAHADPASDWPAALLATNATIVCRGLDGEREIKARDFFLDTFTTAIEPTEILTEVRIRRRTPGQRRQLPEARAPGRRLRHRRRRPRSWSCADDGTIRHAGIGITGVSSSPFAATGAEQLLIGQKPGDEAFRAAGAAAAAASQPVSDVRGPEAYKRAMVAELTVRALRAATERALAFNG